jgi:hypothetical protein
LADFYRYFSESSDGDLRIDARLGAREFYELADIDAKGLDIKDPVRLSHALNHSVF